MAPELTVFEKALEWLSGRYYRAFGTAELAPHERACLERWRAHLSPRGAEILNGQLAEVDLVQRGLKGRIVAFHRVRGPRSAPRFDVSPRRVDAFQVRLRMPGCSDMRGVVVLWDGLLSTLQFNETPRLRRRPKIQAADVEVLSERPLVVL